MICYESDSVYLCKKIFHFITFSSTNHNNRNTLADSIVPVIAKTTKGRSMFLSAMRIGKISTNMSTSKNQMLVCLVAPNVSPASAPSYTRCHSSFDLILSILSK